MKFYPFLTALLIYSSAASTTLAQTAATSPVASSSTQPDVSKREGLRALPNPGLKVFASIGAAPRATILSGRIDKAYRYYNRLLGVEPKLSVLVLTAADHKARYAGDPYGLPFYRDGNLVLPAEESPVLAARIAEIKKLSSNAEDLPRIEHYFELLPVYELAQAYSGQQSTSGKVWLDELLPIMMQHAYVAQNEPGLMPSLETVPRLLSVQDDRSFPHHTLTAFAQTGNEPQNRAWYLAVLATWAPRIYQVDGVDVVKRLYGFLQHSSSESRQVSDTRLGASLEKEVSPTVASIISTWPAQ